MSNASKRSAVALVALVLAACRAEPSQAPTSTPVLIPTILPTPASVVRLEDRLLAAISVKFPDELVFVQDSVWVKTDDGHVIRIDPATNTVVGDVKVDTTTAPYHYCQGLGSDGTNVWACAARGDNSYETIDVVRIDPDSMTVAATVEVGKVFDQLNMPFLGNRIWVLTDNGTKLVGIDASTNQAGPAIDLGTRCFQAAPLNDSLLVTCKLDNLILRVDPEGMAVTERRTLSPSPWNIIATEAAVWVGLGNAAVRLDPQSLETVAAFSGLGGDKDLVATNEGLWVRLDQGFLYRINPASNELAEQVFSDQRVYDMGDLLVTPDSIWTSAGNDDLLLRLSLK